MVSICTLQILEDETRSANRTILPRPASFGPHDDETDGF